MAGSFSRLFTHVVFSTRGRERTIRPSLQSDLFHVFGAAVNQLGGLAVRAGGVDDHVHVIAHIPPRFAPSDFIKDLKGISGDFMRDRVPGFLWQEGFGAFSVSPSQVERVVRYIDNQAQHHGKVPFEVEYRKTLTAAGIEFDEKYLLG